MNDQHSSSLFFTDDHLHRFRAGEHHAIYELLGAHPTQEMYEGQRVDGVRFSVWAPNASKVAVIGDFNGWDGNAHLMSAPAGDLGFSSAL